MQIAVIGGLGFIGREFSTFASSLGHEVMVYDRLPYSVSSDDAFSYAAIDLCSQDTIPFADAIVMLAAIRPYSGFSFDDYESNVRNAESVFAIARRSGIANVVFASSKAVYSDANTMPWTEELYTKPLSLYGASKVAAEQLSELYNVADGMAIKCLRFAQVIGMGERKGYLINSLIDNALQHKQQVVFGDGSQRRQYIYIKDVCRAILAAASMPTAKGVFNIGMPGNVSNLELAECVNDVFGNTGNLVCDSSKPMGTFCDEMDVRKATRELGFDTSYDLRSLFEDIAHSEGK